MVNHNRPIGRNVSPVRSRVADPDERFRKSVRSNPVVKQAILDVLQACCPDDYERLLKAKRSRAKT